MSTKEEVFATLSAEARAAIEPLCTTGTIQALQAALPLFDLGFHSIPLDRVQAHPLQREVDQTHVADLLGRFESGIHRVQYPGIVIAVETDFPLGAPASPEVPPLVPSPFSGLVLSGGHRVAAMQAYCDKGQDRDDLAFWVFRVYHPGA